MIYELDKLDFALFLPKTSVLELSVAPSMWCFVLYSVIIITHNSSCDNLDTEQIFPMCERFKKLEGKGAELKYLC